jgi:hypothetical protein
MSAAAEGMIRCALSFVVVRRQEVVRAVSHGILAPHVLYRVRCSSRHLNIGALLQQVRVAFAIVDCCVCHDAPRARGLTGLLCAS